MTSRSLRSRNLVLRQENISLRARNNAMIQVLATTPILCRTCNEENELRFENTLLRSELETMACFTGKLNECRRLFPGVTAPSVMAVLALKEVGSLARNEAPMWTSNERLNLNEYYSRCFPWYARNVPRFVHEASKAYALISIDASSLVTDLMNPAHYQRIFPSIIGKISTEAPNPKLQMINVDIMLQICPLIETRNVDLLRCSNQVEADTWVVADISTYFSSYDQHLRPKVMRFPSGYLIQQISNGISKVTVLEHWVYREERIMNPSDQNSTFAMKWLNALQRYYNDFATLIPSIGNHIQSNENSFVFHPICQANLLNLSSNMVSIFCTGVCGITGQNWELLGLFGSPVHNIRMLTRDTQSGSPSNMVSVTGVATMQAKPETVFGIINQTRKEDIWNYIQAVENMNEIIRIKKSPDLGNEVTVFKAEVSGLNGWCLVQETYYVASEAIIVHGWIEASSLEAVINSRRDISDVEITICGITVVPCGQETCIVSAGYLFKTGQAVVTSSDEHEVNSLQKLVNDTLKNVENALLVSSNRS